MAGVNRGGVKRGGGSKKQKPGQPGTASPLQQAPKAAKRAAREPKKATVASGATKTLSSGSSGGIKRGGVKRKSKPTTSKPSSVTLNKKTKASNRRAKLDGNSIGDINRRSKTPSQADFKKSVSGFGKIRTSSYSGNKARKTNQRYRQNKGIDDGNNQFKLRDWGDIYS